MNHRIASFLPWCSRSFLLVLLFSMLAAAPVVNAFEEHYRLSPERSSLLLSGGFAGLHDTYSLDGTFGIDYPTHAEEDLRTVSLFDVEITLSGDGNLDGSGLDWQFDLSTFEGSFVHDGTVQFRGQDRQGADFTLALTLGNASVSLAGENSPPCCDFFSYDLDIGATIVQHLQHGRHDLVILVQHFGQHSDAITIEHGDWSGDQIVSLHDLAMVQPHMQENHAAAPAPAAVPEPNALLLMFIGGLGLCARRSKRHR